MLFLVALVSFSISSASADSTLPESVLSTAKTGGAVKLRGATAADISTLKDLDKKYQNSKSISMDLDKTLKLAVLDQERKSKGHILISRGRLRMEIDQPNQSLVVVDGKNIWVVQYPPEEMKNSPVQVIRASTDTKKGRSQSFIGLLVKGGITKYFKVLNATSAADGTTTYFLQPLAGTSDFARAQVSVDPKEKQIKELKYWDELGNETTLSFSNVSFNKKIAANKFQFTPPQNAEITKY